MSIDIAGIGALATAAKGIADKFWPDKTEVEKAKLATELQAVMNEYNLSSGQIDVNKIEAASSNWFVAGWRPACGWVGALGLGYAAIIEPFMRFVATQLGYSGTFPVLDTSITMQVLFGLLGLGAMRTFEKHTGSEKNR